uniref:Uncharacterized protein n=1 Tax=Aegilops tauschii TaxID=37682 RepID=M8B9G0_AEGTA
MGGARPPLEALLSFPREKTYFKKKEECLKWELEKAYSIGSIEIEKDKLQLARDRFADEELRVLEAALSAGGDVAALLSTRSAARKLLRESVAGACAAAAVEGDGARLSVADFFARAFALSGDVESCLAMRYEALVLREAKYSDDLDLHVFHEEWLTFAQDSLDNGFYTIASKAFANALVHIHPSHLDSTNSTLKKNKVNDIRGLQTLAKSLSAQRSVQTQSAEYMKRKTSGVSENCNLHSEKRKLPANLMFRLGIKTRNTQKLLLSRKRNLEELLAGSLQAT